jgi:hypothetical protein
MHVHIYICIYINMYVYIHIYIGKSPLRRSVESGMVTARRSFLGTSSAVLSGFETLGYKSRKDEDIIDFPASTCENAHT